MTLRRITGSKSEPIPPASGVQAHRTRRASTARHFAPRAGAVLASLAAVAATALSVVPTSSASARHPHAGAIRGNAADSPFPVVPQPSPVVLQWYDITNNTINDAAFPQPVTGSNAWDISWVAAAHAVAGGRDPDYQVAALVQALHDTLVWLVPSDTSELDSDLATMLATIPDGAAKSDGIAAGQQQATAEIAARQNDGLDTASVDIPFTPPPPAPGVWQPTPPAYGPAIRAGEGNATPFLLTANNQFDPGPSPSLTSPTYLQSLNETESYGAVDSTVRTPQETDVALFWEPAINIQYIQSVRAIIADTNHSLAWDTRFVAAFQVVTTPVDESGQVMLDEYEKLLGPATRLVAFSHVSNALGTIAPAREMVEMAHRHGARVLIDVPRPSRTCPSTCRTSTATGTRSPGTRCSDRPASALCTARASCSTPALAKDKRAALTPTRQLWDEVGWGRQLDVDVQALLQRRQLAQQLIGFRLEAKIDIYGRLAPAFHHGGRAAGQVDPHRPASRAAKLPGQYPYALLVNRWTHARPRARS
jgi:hypothetical protein